MVDVWGAALSPCARLLQIHILERISKCCCKRCMTHMDQHTDSQLSHIGETLSTGHEEHQRLEWNGMVISTAWELC